MDTIKSSLGFGSAPKPQEKAEAAGSALGGKAGQAVTFLKGRQAQIDAELNKQLGMVPPRENK